MAAAINKLMSDETVIYRSHMHWIVLLVPVLIFLFFGGIGIVVLVGTIASIFEKNSNDTGAFIFMGLVYLLPGAFVLFRGIRQIRSANFVVTDKRVILDSGRGVFKSRTAEIPLDDIRAIEVYQNGFAQAFFSFGTVTVIAEKCDTPPFRCVSRAAEFRRKVYEQMQKLRREVEPVGR